MSVTVSRAALVSALTWASRSLPSRPMNPVLAGIRLQVTDGTLLASSFDLDQSSSASAPAQGEDLDVIVSGRLLVDIARTLSGNTVTFEDKKAHLVMECGRATFSLMKMPRENYPSLPVVPARFGTIAGSALAEAARRVCFAASNDNATPVLTTVLLRVSPEDRTLTLAATDKFCLATTQVGYEPDTDVPGDVREFLIPGKVLDAYGKNLAKQASVGLHADAESEGIFGVSGGGENSTTRVYAGDYPKYAPLIDGKFTLEVSIDPSELVEVVKRVAIMTEGSQGVRLSLTEGALEVSTGGATPSASEILDVDYTDEEISLVFNPSYLVSGLAHFDAGAVRMQMTAPGRPVKFTTGQEGDPFVFLAMPLRV